PDAVRPCVRPGGPLHRALCGVLRPSPRRHDLRRRGEVAGGLPDVARGAAVSVVAAPTPRGGVLSWTAATDHKRIAVLTMATALFLFLVGGIFALVLRLE